MPFMRRKVPLSIIERYRRWVECKMMFLSKAALKKTLAPSVSSQWHLVLYINLKKLFGSRLKTDEEPKCQKL